MFGTEGFLLLLATVLDLTPKQGMVGRAGAKLSPLGTYLGAIQISLNATAKLPLILMAFCYTLATDQQFD